MSPLPTFSISNQGDRQQSPDRQRSDDKNEQVHGLHGRAGGDVCEGQSPKMGVL